MTLKVKFLIIVTIIVAVAVLAAFGFYRDAQAQLAVSPETAVNSTTTSQTLLTFNLKLKTDLPVWTTSVETLGTSTPFSLKVPLAKQADGSFTGSVKIPGDWLNNPKTITFGLYLNGVKTLTTARFAVTDVPVALPPDPGQAGKLTLAGIDSDNDGVRDDIEREIVFMYPGNNQVRRVLTAMVKKEQLVITTTGDHEYFEGLEVSSLAFYSCADYLVFGNNITPKITNINMVDAMVQNTSERLKYGESNYQKSLPFSGPPIMYGTTENNACTQPLVQGQY